MQWLDEWQLEVEQLVGHSTTEKGKMISKETLTGLRMTDMANYLTLPFHFIVLFIVKSFIQLVHNLFTLPEVKSFFSERISQDPLDKYFESKYFPVPKRKPGLESSPLTLTSPGEIL